MNIAFVLPPLEPFSPRGLALSTIVLHTAEELQALGHPTVVVSIADAEGLYDAVPTRAVAVRPLPRVVRRVRRPVERRLGFDWPAQDRWCRAVVAQLASLAEPPDVVITMNDVQLHRVLRRRLPRARRFTWLQNELTTHHPRPDLAFGAVDGFLCCSTFIVQQATAASNGRVHVHHVSNCVDTSAFSPGGSSDVHPEVRLLFAGRIEPSKGPDAIVGASTRAMARGARFELTLAGPKISYSLTGRPYDEWLRRLLDDVEAVGGHYVGHVGRPELPELYRSHDACFVLSRTDEPFGLVALEAMASGCLVIASRRGGLVEATGGHAVYVDPDDEEEIASVIQSLSDNMASFESQRARGIEWAATRGWHNAAVALLDAVSPRSR